VTVPVLSLRCYRCGTEYGYVGSEPHPATCPSCRESCVAPAGRLTVEESAAWERLDGRTTVWVRATDERARPFEFEVTADAHGGGEVAALKVDGVSLDPSTDEALERVPRCVREELARKGVTPLSMLATRSSERTSS
jgi:hypothetical protein